MKQTDDFRLDFIGVGPQRTGTSWLHQMLYNHPNVSLPQEIKETMYFDKYYDKGMSWLSKHYYDNKTNSIVGEIGPSYFGSDHVIERIYNQNPDCRIIVNIRNPIDQAYSLYLHEFSKGRITEPLLDVINLSPERLIDNKYSTDIPKWQDKFGKRNVTCLWMDEIRIQPKNVYSQVCTFLGITDTHFQESLASEQINTRKMSRHPALTKFGTRIYYLFRQYRLHKLIALAKRIKLDKYFFKGNNESITPSISFEEHSILKEQLEDEIVYLESISGRDLTNWRIHQGDTTS